LSNKKGSFASSKLVEIFIRQSPPSLGRFLAIGTSDEFARGLLLPSRTLSQAFNGWPESFEVLRAADRSLKTCAEGLTHLELLNEQQ
jgi:hypothetical protein